jgi:acetyl-CoA carboxylase carboxyl transferase subunit beta
VSFLPATLFVSDLSESLHVCPRCGYHFRMKRKAADFRNRGRRLVCGALGRSFSKNILDFPGYDKKLLSSSLESAEKEAVVCGTAKIGGVTTRPFCHGAFFMMGSMGCAVGKRLPACLSFPGKKAFPWWGIASPAAPGCRKGFLSLMQMAKVSGAVKRHSDAGGLYIAVLCDPTTGGVTASFAMEGDYILAEPGALIGFAGRGSSSRPSAKSCRPLPEGGIFAGKGIRRRRGRKKRPKKLSYASFIAPTKRRKEMSAYDKVSAARAKDRPTGIDFIQNIISDFIEFHGDRRFGDDKAVVAGIGRLLGMPVTVIAHEKGKNTKDKLFRNFGSAHPEGYRKALRQMKLAEKFSRPVLCLIDTSGAYCGLGAEERGQGQAIAENLMEMMTLKTPVLSVLIGEGGSGGALALGVSDEVWMLENSVYSVISPEGCASILWKDPAKTKEAAECLKLTAGDLYRLGVVEQIVPEYSGDYEKTYARLQTNLARKFSENMRLSQTELLEKRYKRFRRMGGDAL